jgi:hypothetical protein
MPVRRGTTTKDGKRVGYYQWDQSGKKYTYQIGNGQSRERAKAKAAKQGRAAKASQ